MISDSYRDPLDIEADAAVDDFHQANSPESFDAPQEIKSTNLTEAEMMARISEQLGVRNTPRGTSITDILARNAQAVKRQQFGDPSGDPEGNADEASAGERYDGLLTKALLASWHLPPTISEKELLHLHAIPRVWILPDGTVTRWEIVASSGNGQFDAAMERALQDLRAARAPPPPPELRDELRTQGRKLWFKP